MHIYNFNNNKDNNINDNNIDKDHSNMASLLERKEFSKLMICALYYPCMDILEKMFVWSPCTI